MGTVLAPEDCRGLPRVKLSGGHTGKLTKQRWAVSTVLRRLRWWRPAAALRLGNSIVRLHKRRQVVVVRGARGIPRFPCRVGSSSRPSSALIFEQLSPIAAPGYPSYLMVWVGVEVGNDVGPCDHEGLPMPLLPSSGWNRGQEAEFHCSSSRHPGPWVLCPPMPAYSEDALLPSVKVLGQEWAVVCAPIVRQP